MLVMIFGIVYALAVHDALICWIGGKTFAREHHQYLTVFNPLLSQEVVRG